jgi:trimeric autotransporter adhesin
MNDRFSPWALLLIALTLPIAGCTNQQVDSLSISPTSQSLSVNQTVQFTATATTDHGKGAATTQNVTSSVTWTSSSPAVATINAAGLATALSPGTTTVTASTNGYSGTLGATALLTVTSTTSSGPTGNDVVSLTILPNSQTVGIAGDTATYTAVGVTSAGTDVNVSGLVVWSAVSPQIATVNAITGVVTAVGQGSTSIEATYTNADKTIATGTANFTVTGTGTTNTDITSVTIIPSSQSVAGPGDTATYTAVGTTASGQTQNLNGVVVWGGSSPQIESVNATTGVVTAVGPGTATVTAQFTNPDKTTATGTATFTVTGTGTTNTDITSVTIIPGAQTVAATGDTATYAAIGTTASGQTESLTGLVVWSGSSPQIASVNATTGVVTAVGPGTATVAAQFTNPDKTTATGTATFTVTGTGAVSNDITSLTIIPGAQSVPALGDSATYIAVGTTGAGTTVSMSGLAVWNSSSPQIATINTTTGIAMSTGPGTATISAQYTNADKTTATGTATLTVTGNGTPASDITQVTIVPSNQSVAAIGDTATYTAVGTTAGGVTKNLNGTVVWSAASPQIASVNATTGVATAAGQGTTTISAQYTNTDGTFATGSATFTVTGSASTTDITSLTIVPGSQSVPSPGGTANYVAIGTTASGTTVSMQGLVSWSSASTTIAQINSATGVAVGIAQGSTTISASYTNADGTVASGSATFTVIGGTTETYTSLTIIPNSESVSASGQSANLIALATSGVTGLSQVVTTNAALKWSSSIPTVATVSSSGVVTGVSQGTTTITAVLQNPDLTVVSATATITVTLTAPPEPLLSLTIIPNTITVGNLQATGNFLAIGTYSVAPYVRDLTNSVAWISSFPNDFPVVTSNSSGANTGVPAGTVTAYASGSATIIAEATDPTTGSIQTAQETFNCPLVLPDPPTTPGSCYSGSEAPSLLATVTVYNEGLNTTDWQITAPSATNTPNVIHCGPGWTLNGGTGGSVCVATYPVGTSVTLTATGGSFGGWSSSCLPPLGTANPSTPSAAGPNTCTFTISDSNPNVTVGAIFN